MWCRYEVFVSALLLLSMTVCSSTHAQQFSSDVEMISFDESGIISANSQRRLNELCNGPAPSDLIVAAHGWNNTFSGARDSYRGVMATMKSTASRLALVNSGYRSVVIGVSWPSLALDDSADRVGRSVSDGSDDALALYRSFPRGERDGVEYDRDMQFLQELMAQPPGAVSQTDMEQLSQLFRKYRINAAAGVDSDDAEYFAFSQAGRGLIESGMTVKQAIGVFSYWQMKERAGVVGAGGCRKMLTQLQTSFPSSRIHLIGHSFGCKLWLSCISGSDVSDPMVDSLVLLQGAVSYQAMSPLGGYAGVPSRVRGPVVATFSDNDIPLGIPYELASFAAGQTAEGRSVSKYAALGRVGPEFGERSVISVAQRRDEYRFGRKLYGLAGGVFIAGHSDFNNEAVARMMWAAMMPASEEVGTEGGGEGRVASEGAFDSELQAAAETASLVIGRSSEDLSAEALADLYSETLESSVAASTRRSLGAREEHSVLARGERLGPLVSGWVEDARVPRGAREVVGSSFRRQYFDDRFFGVESYNRSMRAWLVDERSRGSVARVWIGTEGGCDNPADTTYKQCVGVCFRPRIEGASYRAIGSGFIVDWDAVITAAHVVPDSKLMKLSSDLREQALQHYEFAISVGAGTPDFEFGHVPPGTVLVPVKARIEHPDCDGNRFLNDVAIMHLDRELDPMTVFGDAAVRDLPIKVADQVLWGPDDLSVVTLVGFGFCDRSERKGFGKRRAAENVLATVPDTEAEARAIGCHLGLEFAAGGQGVDTCKGDSGGPVLARNGSGDLVCVGITSRASRMRLSGGAIVAGVPGDDKCGDGGVYVLCPKYGKWFQEALVRARAAAAGPSP